MSCIYFHSKTGEAKLRGSERAHFGVLLGDIFNACLGSTSISGAEDILRIVAPGHYLHRSSTPDASLPIAIRSGADNIFVLKGHVVDSFPTLLNTSLAIGSRALKLAARIHGQCEMHGYVEGKNRAWMAEVIEEGLRDGFYRREDYLAGWAGVREFLLSDSESPVVMSYSVCDQFPNRGVVTRVPDEEGGAEADEEAWYDLPADIRWDRAMTALRKSYEGTLELKPEGFEEYRFGDGITAFTLADEVLRLARLAKPERYGLPRRRPEVLDATI